VKAATTIAANLANAAALLFTEVKVTPILNGYATRANLETIIERMARDPPTTPDCK
jgi:hypothetical protein